MNKENQTYEIYYDKEGDFLEVSFGESAKEGTTEEIERGIFITFLLATPQGFVPTVFVVLSILILSFLIFDFILCSFLPA